MKIKILILLLLVGFLLFFYKVGDRDLWAPDEAEYAQMSREVIRFDNWAFLTVNGQPWAIKPVLYNWLNALVSLPWVDVDEFRARIFSSLAALGTFLATVYIGRRAFSPLARNFAYRPVSRKSFLLEFGYQLIGVPNGFKGGESDSIRFAGRFCHAFWSSGLFFWGRFSLFHNLWPSFDQPL